MPHIQGLRAPSAADLAEQVLCLSAVRKRVDRPPATGATAQGHRSYGPQPQGPATSEIQSPVGRDHSPTPCRAHRRLLPGCRCAAGLSPSVSRKFDRLGRQRDGGARMVKCLVCLPALRQYPGQIVLRDRVLGIAPDRSRYIVYRPRRAGRSLTQMSAHILRVWSSSGCASSQVFNVFAASSGWPRRISDRPGAEHRPRL